MSRAPDRPNILIVTTDQQRTDTLSCYGSTFTDTPNLDALATQGARFDRAYCSNPVCTPSRASIFTGLCPSRHGAWNVGTNVPDQQMISHRLADVGYTTCYLGKAHFQAFLGTPQQSVEAAGGNLRYPDWRGPYYGFESVELAMMHGHAAWQSGHYGAWLQSQIPADQIEAMHTVITHADSDFGGQAYDWPLPARYHHSTWVADRTVDYLEKYDGAKPFLLAVGFPDPHHPHAVPTDFVGKVDPQQTPLPDWDEGELDDKPPHFLETRLGRLEQSAMCGHYPITGQGYGIKKWSEDSHDRKQGVCTDREAEYDQVGYTDVTFEEARLGRSYYYSLVKLIDQQMGRILDCLDRTGLAENTLVIFTTDHGELLGDHGLWRKGPFHYEQLVRIPMLMRWPRGFDGGQEMPGLVSVVDIVPTCLAAAGLQLPDDTDGREAISTLQGRQSASRDSVLIECLDDPEKLYLKTIVTADRKLTWYRDQPYGELYDLEADPREKVNLWLDPLYAADRADLLSQLLSTLEPPERHADRYAYA